jgi:hypothetical protein
MAREINYVKAMAGRSNADLLEITTTLRDGYEPEAVEAAEMELARRNLSHDELALANKGLEEKQTKEKLRQEQITSLENKATGLFEFLHPLKEKTTGQAINLITIGLALCYLILLYNQLDLIEALVYVSPGTTYDLFDLTGIAIFLLPYLIFPVALVYFWRAKKLGWVLLTGFLTYLAMDTVFACYLDIKWATMSGSVRSTTGPLVLTPTDNTILDIILGGPGLVVHVTQLIILLSLVVFLNNKSVIEKYGIPRQTQVITLVIMAALPITIYAVIRFLASIQMV